MAIRMTGLVSGLDTDAIISALVSAYNYKITNYQKAQTKLSWKQDAWSTLNSKIYSFYTSLDALRFSSGYNLKSTTVSDSTKATVTTDSSAINGTQTLQIKQLAQAGYLTGAQLDSGTTSSTTLAELGYTGGDGTIDVTMADGTTTSITVSQGTTISSLVSSLKEAGLNASYDETNRRFYVSSTTTGADNDFTLTGANLDGVSALTKLGLNVESSATTATYESVSKYYLTSDGETVATADDIESLLSQYESWASDSASKTAQNSNLSSAYSYATAYSALQDTLSGLTGLSDSDKSKLTTLLGMTATERTNSLMDADGNVYTQSGTDADGNKLYYDADGKLAYQAVNTSTYTGTDADGNEVTYTVTGAKGDYVASDGTTYARTVDEETGAVTYVNTQDADDVLDTSKLTTGETTTAYYAVTSSTIDVDEEGNETGTVTVTVSPNADTSIQTASDVLTSIEESDEDELDSATISSLTSNISTVNSYESAVDAVLDDDDEYSHASIVSAIHEAYANGGADAVTTLTNTYAQVISDNKTAIAEDEANIADYTELASIADLEGEERTDAIDDLLDRAATAYEVQQNAGDYYSSGAVKIDGADAIIELNGVEYTNSTNAFSINGLTINALATTGDDVISITTQTDTQGIYDKIKDFLTSYNSLINEICSLYNADSAKGYDPLTDEEKDAMSDSEVEKWEQKIKDALLKDDSTLSSIMNAMTSAMSAGFEIDGKTYYLSSFGISTLGYLNAAENEQYAYHIAGDSDDSSSSAKDDKLLTAITNDPDTVMSFFQQLVNGLYTAIGNKMSSSSLSSTYTVYNDKEMASEYSDYTDQISKWEEKLQEKEDYYYSQFAAMESALAKLQSQQSSLSSLLGG